MVCTSRGSCILKGKPLNPVSTTTTTIPGGPEVICDEFTTSCFHSYKKCPDGYDYCEYDWESPCGSKFGVLNPGQYIPWFACMSRGNCTLIGYK
ncbi:MAG: hypothetical protein CO092_00820 [Candidatus Aenigmarchaeota archaeon CG_4_9_14_3_um_filter_37_18]|nr:MAG: hypothetical protein AUJ50_02020 [Candidatus Aenigmarchaeota archaeon CG1_02_38_14]PIW41625.1 MAG: hypothetical protein COW21_00865 [Candidatus Aenigmarchaeota archaeon CG15_BIG_FIL_POST_REV_8_21_14_020_37_27]PIY35926.1 MAG: hypothetical protein COZ04_01900 [Candidatus Aenigmarchaeota archaeon CG_4_10_14_3_um_filter_37_21]PJB75834.1 MAG: hypothetical protein CO092_00820 [Candidatus Aenigmarchaeota archaeon CG_4_9_14_3_um_filter_37_18]